MINLQHSKQLKEALKGVFNNEYEFESQIFNDKLRHEETLFVEKGDKGVVEMIYAPRAEPPIAAFTVTWLPYGLEWELPGLEGTGESVEQAVEAMIKESLQHVWAGKQSLDDFCVKLGVVAEEVGDQYANDEV